jgi:acetyl esterase/lipase
MLFVEHKAPALAEVSLMKRLLLSTALAFLAGSIAASVLAQSSPGPQTIPPASTNLRPTIRLWPGKAPGSEDWTYNERVTEGPGGAKTYYNVVDPTLTVYLPESQKANGAAIIVCPGGAMRMVAISDRDSTAEWLNSKGISAFILKYRLVPDSPPAAGRGRPAAPSRSGLPGGMGNELSFNEILNRHGNANPAPDNPEHVKIIGMAIADGQQAIRLLRRDAAKYHLDPKRVGIMGFSAGGGVAVGTAVTESTDGYPDFVATIYGPSLVDVSVPKQGAPLFIAVMDGHFNVTHGCAALFTLWQEARRPVEIHVYDHAYGPASGMPVSNWTDRLYDWLRARKIVTE